MTDEEHKLLTNILDSVRETKIEMDEIKNVVNGMDADLIKDRSKLDNLEVNDNTIISMVSQVHQRQERTEDKTMDAIGNGFAQTIKAASKLPKRSWLLKFLPEGR